MILTAADSMDDQWFQGKPFNTRACSYKTNDARLDCWAALLTINTRVSEVFLRFFYSSSLRAANI